MARFILFRTASMIFVLFAISVLVFLIFFATPGVDPAARIAGREADQQTLQQVRHDFGLDKPKPVQYVILMKKLFVTRDLTSYVNRGATVWPQVTEAIPVTLSLVLGASVIWILFSVGMGLVAAVFRGTPVDAGVMVLGLIGISMPVFWLGEMVNLVSQSRFHDTFLFSWVPPLGYIPFTVSPVGWFKALLLPWITLSILYIGIYARVLRSSLIESQSQDYVRTAHAKGLTGTPRPDSARAAHLDARLRQPLRARFRRTRRRRGSPHGGRVRPARDRLADLPVAPELRPARDHGHGDVRGVLRRRRERGRRSLLRRA